jgi:biotin carboxyl carrier protein
MNQINVNGKFTYDVVEDSDGLLINGVKINPDIQNLSGLSWHIINNLQSYNAEVIGFNAAEKKATIKINNNVYTITAKNELDILLDKLGLGNLNASKVSDIKAPMPGMVLKVFVTEGMEVKKDDSLFVLEAMKMENIIKSTADGFVKSVKIRPGDKVEKNQVLMIF